MLKFTKVKLHNFLSYKDAELKLDNQGVTLIEGDNKSNDSYTSSGSGKSSLLSAITYGLYGKTVTGLTSNAVINKSVGTDCFVELYFDIEDSHYCIKRYRKGKQGNGNKVRLYLNSNEITEATNPKTDKAIQDLIGIQFNTYVNTISYGSSDEPVFSQATDKGKKEILENLANTTVYSKAKDLASEDLKEYKNKLEQEKLKYDNSTNMIKHYKELEEQDKERYEKEQAHIKENKATLELKKQEQYNYAKKAKKRLTELKNAKQSLIKEKPQSDITNQLREINVALDKTNTAINKINTFIYRNTSKLKDYQQQYKELASKTNCPVCGQTLDAQHKQQELNSILVKAKEAKTKLIKYKTTLDKLNILKQQQVTKKDTIQSKVTDFNREYKKYQDTVNKIDNTITEIELKNNNYTMQVNALETAGRLELEPLKCYNNDIKIEEEKLVESKEKITNLNNKIDSYTILVNKVFSKEGITSVVLDLITPYLNEHANYYLNKLSGSILTINMNTQKLNANKTISDKFDLQVYNSAGADSYQNCSAGERKRIDIAISFAIQDLQQSHSETSTNIAIYDECFDGLDSVGCESVIEILKEKAKTIPSIFVITHNETLKPLFDNAIKVVKSKEGISKIEE